MKQSRVITYQLGNDLTITLAQAESDKNLAHYAFSHSGNLLAMSTIALPVTVDKTGNVAAAIIALAILEDTLRTGNQSASELQARLDTGTLSAKFLDLITRDDIELIRIEILNELCVREVTASENMVPFIRVGHANNYSVATYPHSDSAGHICAEQIKVPVWFPRYTEFDMERYFDIVHNTTGAIRTVTSHYQDVTMSIPYKAHMQAIRQAISKDEICSEWHFNFNSDAFKMQFPDMAQGLYADQYSPWHFGMYVHLARQERDNIIARSHR